ncbi:TraX family protein [Oribacterium sp. WCC10]|uniref:TraX family protein n=1 Tax=Oribacterium sp. WCC10 TaxID=1855343 RepID=UPI0008E7534C|nr:TraX family protein [Oribacterium sp. WCC10]SFG18684.1 TraX protein [Oribacterium sp. WCC10]
MTISIDRKHLKYLAILAMVLDHISEIILIPGLKGEGQILMNLHLSVPVAELLKQMFIGIGSMTGAVMIFGVIEGYHYTKDAKKYLLRLILFGLLSQYPFYMAFKINLLNMMFSLALCLMTVHVHYRTSDVNIRIMLKILLLLANMYTDWSMLAVPFTLILLRAMDNRESIRGAHEPVNREQLLRELESRDIGYENDKKHYHGGLFSVSDKVNRNGRFLFDRGKLKAAWVCCILLCIVEDLLSGKTFPEAVLVNAGVIMAAVLITYFYDGTEGKKSKVSKYGFYLFYPIHLIVLTLIYQILR